MGGVLQQLGPGNTAACSLCLGRVTCTDDKLLLQDLPVQPLALLLPQTARQAHLPQGTAHMAAAHLLPEGQQGTEGPIRGCQQLLHLVQDQHPAWLVCRTGACRTDGGVGL